MHFCVWQTFINVLLAFDSYFAFYYPYLESIPFKAPMEVREERAFDNMLKAIDMFEMFERLSINNHKSFLPHLAVYKVCSLACASVVAVSPSAPHATHVV